MVSCTEIELEDIPQSYFFTTNNGGDIGIHGCGPGIPLKINPLTDSITPVCIDPFCTNDVFTCPLADCRLRAIAGNYMFFISNVLQDESDSTKKLCLYDINSGNTDIIIEFHDYPMFIKTYSTYLFFNDISIAENSMLSVQLCRVNGANKKLEYLSNSDSILYNSDYGYSYDSFPQIMGFDNDKIYWCSLNSDFPEYYTTDLKNNNKKILETHQNTIMANAVYSDGYIYYTQPYQADTSEESDPMRRHMENTLYSISLNTSEIKILCPYMAEYVLSEDMIYYTVCEDSPTEIKCEDKITYDWYGGKIYSMRASGGESTNILDADLNIGSYGDTFLSALRIDGVDYLQLSFYDWCENDLYESGKEYIKSTSTIVFNTQTKSYRVVAWQ